MVGSCHFDVPFPCVERGLSGILYVQVDPFRRYMHSLRAFLYVYACVCVCDQGLLTNGECSVRTISSNV